MRERWVEGMPLNEREQVTARERDAELRNAELRNGIRLWHDDIRPAPTGWRWARTNAAAQEILATGHVFECSLDHDLGLDYIEMPERYEALNDAQKHNIFLAGVSEETGLDLVRWMIATGNVPPRITVHSWNHDKGAEMCRTFNDAGYDVTRTYYSDEYRAACDA